MWLSLSKCNYSGPACKNGLEACGLLRLIFLHLLLHEELSHLWSATNLHREMHAAGSLRERLDAIVLAERVAHLGRGGQGQQAVLLKFRHQHRLLALVTGELAGIEVVGPQESWSGRGDTYLKNACYPGGPRLQVGEERKDGCGRRVKGVSVFDGQHVSLPFFCSCSAQEECRE